MTNFTGIVYDCDGVIIDSRTANDAFYNKVLAYFDLPPMTQEQSEFAFMATAMQALQHILPQELHSEISRVVSQEINYNRDIVPHLKLMPGFRTLICDLHKLGIRQAVATNRTDNGFKTLLDFFALPPYFSPIVTASNAQPKPSPEGLLRICQDWGVEKSQMLFVGDSTHDQEAALSAQIPFVAFNNKKLQGDFSAACFAELRHILAPMLPFSA